MQKFPSLNFSHRFFQFLNWHVGCALLLIWVLILIKAIPSAADDRFTKVKSLIGPNDSLIVTDSENRLLVSKNKNKKLVPASILKLLTSLAAIHYLGQEYRYVTEFYLDRHSNLKIKGFGDPLLVSEVVNEMAGRLTDLVGNSLAFNDLVVDDSQFNQPLTIPGISSSSQPYDAPNGALCVNFNTVFFKHTRAGYISAEAQTPLLPYAKTKIRARNLKNGRFVLSHLGNENTIYAGNLFRYFLERHGAGFSGKVQLGQVNKPEIGSFINMFRNFLWHR